MKILFICGRNKRRSPTAEALYRNDARCSVRSGGTAETSTRRVSQNDLEWADLVLVMERKYAARLRERFIELHQWPEIRSLDIPDVYEKMDPELVELLQLEVESILQRLRTS